MGVWLVTMLQAANYLDIKGLLDVTCKTVANMIKGKSPEEIRKTFNIKNDFTPAEEEQVCWNCRLNVLSLRLVGTEMVVRSKFMVSRRFLMKSTGTNAECGREKGITYTWGVRFAADSAACGGGCIIWKNKQNEKQKTF